MLPSDDVLSLVEAIVAMDSEVEDNISVGDKIEVGEDVVESQEPGVIIGKVVAWGAIGMARFTL